MNRVTSVLREEHQLIRRAAACLERLADETLERGELLPVTSLELMEFFEDFADQTHQGKEERYVFPALIHAGLASRHVAELVADHRRDRVALERLRRNLDDALHGERSRARHFADLAHAFARHQWEHIEEEDQLLLPLIEELLDTDAEQRVIEGFERHDQRSVRSWLWYGARIERIAARYGSMLAHSR